MKLKNKKIFLILPLFFLIFSCIQQTQQPNQTIIREKKIYTDFSKTPEGKLIEEGDNYLKNEKYDEALKAYNEALKIDDKLSMAYEKIGYICYLKNNLDKAIEYTNKAINLDTTNSTYYNDLGLFQTAKSNYLDAERNLNKSIELDSKNAYPYYNLIELYMKLNNLDKAIEYSKKIIEMNNYDNAYKLLDIYLIQKNYIEAEKLCQIIFDKTGFSYYWKIALFYSDEKNTEKELEMFIKDINLDSNSIWYSSVASIYEKQSKTDLAIKFLNAGIFVYESNKNQKEEMVCRSYLAEIYLKQGNYNDALLNSKKAVELANLFKGSGYHERILASIYEKQNNIKEATINYQKACDLGDQDSCKWIKG